MESIIEFAERRIKQCARDGDYHDLQYWVGYRDGAMRILSKIKESEINEYELEYLDGRDI